MTIFENRVADPIGAGMGGAVGRLLMPLIIVSSEAVTSRTAVAPDVLAPLSKLRAGLPAPFSERAGDFMRRQEAKLMKRMGLTRTDAGVVVQATIPFIKVKQLKSL